MRFVGKRLALFVAALVGLSALVFVMLRVLPGDVAAVIAGTNATPERIASLRAEFGLDKPLVAQYGDWMAGMLHGDLGVSASRRHGRSRVQVAVRACRHVPADRAEPCRSRWRIGLPLGCAAVLTTQSAAGAACSTCIAIVGGAVPALWGGLLLILLFSRGTGLLGLLPAQGFPDTGWATPGKALSCLLLPALTTGITAGAVHHALHACRSGGYGAHRRRWTWPWPAA